MWGHYMKMKKVSLRELVADKIVYAVLLALTYWLWARNDWKDYYTTIQYVIDVFAFFYFVSRSIRVKKYKQEEPDEMSEANLKRCDAICLKIVVGLIVALGFVCAAGRFAISTEIIGYGLMGTLVLLAVIRTVLFCSMDKKDGADDQDPGIPGKAGTYAVRACRPRRCPARNDRQS